MLYVHFSWHKIFRRLSLGIDHEKYFLFPDCGNPVSYTHLGGGLVNGIPTAIFGLRSRDIRNNIVRLNIFLFRNVNKTTSNKY